MEKEDYKRLNLRSGADPGEGSLFKDAAQVKRASRIKKLIIAVIILVIAAGTLRITVGPPILFANISSYENQRILVKGLSGGDFYITPGQLAKMSLENFSVTGESSSGTKTYVKCIGPTMDTFLTALGEKKSDYSQVTFIGSDDYSTVFVKTFQDDEIILSIANGFRALESTQEPLRIVVPSEDSGKWIRSVTKIEFKAKRK